MSQAVTQSLQPVAHFVVSISMPQRTLALAPARSGVAGLAISIRWMPGRQHARRPSAGGGQAEEAAPALVDRLHGLRSRGAACFWPALAGVASKQSSFTAA